MRDRVPQPRREITRKRSPGRATGSVSGRPGRARGTAPDLYGEGGVRGGFRIADTVRSRATCMDMPNPE